MWFIFARHKKEKYFKNIASRGDWTGLNDSFYCCFKTTATRTAYFWKVHSLPQSVLMASSSALICAVGVCAAL